MGRGGGPGGPASTKGYAGDTLTDTRRSSNGGLPPHREPHRRKGRGGPLRSEPPTPRPSRRSKHPKHVRSNEDNQGGSEGQPQRETHPHRHYAEIEDHRGRQGERDR